MNTDDLQFTSAGDNPEAANAAIAAALADSVIRSAAQEASGTFPDAPRPTDDAYKLLAGIDTGSLDGTMITDFSVRELTGRDEERIAKARSQGTIYKWMNAILLSGIETIGGKAPTLDLLDKMLIGDREFALTKVRMATFGEDVEFGVWPCTECGEDFDAKVNLREIEMKPLKNDERYLRVPISKDRTAVVRVPIGSDQAAFLAVDDDSIPAKNTALLERVVEAVAEGGGAPRPIIGESHSFVLNMGIRDRKKILDALADCQPGPRYDEVTITHSCGAVIPAPLGLVSLFPGL